MKIITLVLLLFFGGVLFSLAETEEIKITYKYNEALPENFQIILDGKTIRTIEPAKDILLYQEKVLLENVLGESKIMISAQFGELRYWSQVYRFKVQPENIGGNQEISIEIICNFED
jgi:hypothetical protein